MTRQIELKDALGSGSWPPKNAAASDESPLVDSEDIITSARLSSNGHLVLNLKRDALKFDSSTLVPEKFRGSIETVLEKIASKTIDKAGDVMLCVPQDQEPETTENVGGSL